MRLVGKARQRARAKARQQQQPWNPTAGAYFHGGRAGMTPGSVILPLSELGDRYIAEKQLLEAGADDLLHHTTQIFFTNNAAFALAFAGRRPYPAVYEVVPTAEPIERDEDAPAGVGSWRCPRARVVAVVPVPFKVLQQLNIRLRSRIAGEGYDFEGTWMMLTAALE